MQRPLLLELLLQQPSQPGGEGGKGGVLVKRKRRRRGGRDVQTGRGDGALRYLVDVPFLTSQMLHLNASAVFLKVHTLQSQ